MNEYQIQTLTPNNDYGMFLLFWGAMVILKKDNRFFCKYRINSKEEPTLPNDCSIETHNFNETKKLKITKNGSIDYLVDNLGNVYYEVTSIL